MYKKLLTLSAFVLAFSWLAALSSANGAYATEPKTVRICHATNSATNPYVVLKDVSVNAVNGLPGDNGGKNEPDHYGEHKGPLAYSEAYAAELKKDKTDWGDIIPPVAGHAGLNWTPLGIAMWENGCNYVKFVEPTAPEFIDPTCEAEGSYTIPRVKGLKYFVNDVKTKAGTYFAKAGDTITVTVEAKAGYFIPAETQTEWTHEFIGPEVCGGDENSDITFMWLCTDDGVVVTLGNTGNANGYASVNGTEYEVPAGDKVEIVLPQDADGVQITVVDLDNQDTVFDNTVDCAPGEVLGDTDTKTPTALPATAGEFEAIVSVLVATLATAGATVFGLRRFAQQ